MLGTGVILGEKYLFAVDDVRNGKTAREVENSFKAVGDSGLDAIFYNDTVNDYLDIVLLVLVKLDILAEFIHDTVNSCTDKARFSCTFKLL